MQRGCSKEGVHGRWVASARYKLEGDVTRWRVGAAWHGVVEQGTPYIKLITPMLYLPQSRILYSFL